MNILVDIGHPGHVHFFKHAISAWKNKGHVVIVTARRIPVVHALLESCGLAYESISTKRKGAIGLGRELIEHATSLYPRLRKHKIDVCTAVGGTFMVHAALLAGCKRIIFYDTETATVANRITYPFASKIVTPEYYPHSLGRRHIRYRGFQELAYLHPSRFNPDSRVLEKYELSNESPFCIVRLGSYEASHDIGVKAMSLDKKMILIQWLQKIGRTIILAEGKIPDEFKEMSLIIAPADYHHLLYYATCVLTEGATTALESSILGTPALYINPIRPACLNAASRYGLLAISSMETPLDELKRLIDLAGNRVTARAKARALVNEHCDVTARVVDIVERAV